jgi:hypothetical protein
MFIRIYRKSEDKEVLINLNSVWKIEVQYAVPEGERAFKSSLEHGLKDPAAIRIYRIFFGGESALLAAAPDDPVINAIEKLYNEAIKGNDSLPEET